MPAAVGTVRRPKAAPDGYTLLLAPNTFAIAQFVLKTNAGSSYDVLGGFHAHRADQRAAHVRGRQPELWASRTSGPGEPGQARRTDLCQPGSGSPMHILGEMFNKAAGASCPRPTGRGARSQRSDRRPCALTFMTWGPIAPYAGGKVGDQAVADAQRSPLAPNVPTLAEQGRMWKCRPGKACSVPGMKPETVKPEHPPQ